MEGCALVGERGMPGPWDTVAASEREGVPEKGRVSV